MAKINYRSLDHSVRLTATPEAAGDYLYEWRIEGPANYTETLKEHGEEVEWDVTGLTPGDYTARLKLLDKSDHHEVDAAEKLVSVLPSVVAAPAAVRTTAVNGNGAANPPVPVTLQRSQLPPTDDIFLWTTILQSTRALSFEGFSRAMDLILCGLNPNEDELAQVEDIKAKARLLLLSRSLPFNDTDAYRLLKIATEAIFLAHVRTLGEVEFDETDFSAVSKRLGSVLSQAQLDDLRDRYLKTVDGVKTLPYLALVRRKLKDQDILSLRSNNGLDAFSDRCQGILQFRLTQPLFIELVWSYWHEEGMQVQTMKAVSRRFQNVRSNGGRDPLANLEIDPLRPLSNLLWGYVQDEQHRLSVRRRAFEYDHHYGIGLHGKAVGALSTADSRSKFLEAFHNLLYLATLFYQQDDDATVNADAFPLLNALRDVHMILNQGAHNQFGDLPSTARQEMLLEQWLLARPEFREFLPTRIMVAYPEEWMDRVDAMKTLQGWTNTSVMHFNDLAVNGERVLLAIRYGAWSDTNDPLQAANWARFWRPEVQRYLYAYRTVTGIDLSADLSDSPRQTERYLPPTVHLQRQLEQQRRSALPAPRPVASLLPPERSRVKR